MFWLITLVATWLVILTTLLFLHRHSRSTINNGRRLTLLSLLFITPFAFAGYVAVKQPQAWTYNYKMVRAAEENKQQNAQNLIENIDSVIANLEQRVEQNPQAIEERKLLASSYMVNQQSEKAIVVYTELMDLMPQDPDIPTRIAELKLSASNGKVTEEITSLINAALEIEPQHISANWLLAISQEQGGNVSAAVGTLTALNQWVKNEDQRASIDRQLSRLQGMTEASSPMIVAEEGGDIEKSTQVVSNTEVPVNVMLAPEWSDQLSEQDTLFVYAYAVDGPRFPLAVYRGTIADLPLSITLDDSLAMMPDQGISKYTVLRIGAHSSKDGTAKAKPGDLFTEIDQVDVSNLSEPLVLTLDTVKQ